MQDKRVEFDSCSIRGIKGDSSKTAFKVHFDSLRLTNINFDTLFYSEVIKADSAFAANPKIYLDIDADQKTVKHTKRIQRIDDLIQQLVGDIMLKYVVVQNGYLNINTIRKGKINRFTSDDNDFELQGFQVRQNYEHPVRVDKFLMTLHNYQTSLQNGRYATSFDSIQFLNDAIYLTKFRLREFKEGKVINDVRMPQFELKGLSWESLIYDNKFNANSAVFTNPDIIYAVPQRKDHHRKSIFQTLSDVGKVMNLDALNIRNGNILLNFHSGATLKLEKASLSVIPDKLTASKEVKNIQNSVRSFNFSKALFKRNDVTAELDNVQVDNTNGIRAAAFTLNGHRMDATAHGIVIRDLVLDSVKRSLLLSGVNWDNATLIYHKGSLPPHEKKEVPLFLHIKDLDAKNTSLHIFDGDKEISAFLNTVAAKKIYKRKEPGLLVEELSLSGKDFLLTAPDTRLSVEGMTMHDKQSSSFKNFFYQKRSGADSLQIAVPEITITPDITRMMNNDLTLDKIKLTDPAITGSFSRKDSSGAAEHRKPGTFILGEALLERPKVMLQFVNKKNEINTVKWDGSTENSYLHLYDLKSTPDQLLSVGQMNTLLTGFELINNGNGKRHATDSNKLEVQLNNLRIEKQPDSNQPAWNTLLSIHTLNRLVFDSLGKNNAVLKLDTGAIRNIYLSSKTINNAGEILKASAGLSMNNSSGMFITPKNTLQWYNLDFKNGFFKADSLEVGTNQDLASFLKKKAFPGDYLSLHTGAITGGPVNTLVWATDSILKIGGMQVAAARLLSVKDKTQPNPPKYKRLPTDLILALPLKLAIDSLNLSNMYVEYREVNAKTRRMGIIPVENLNARFYHIKNYDVLPTDSLFIYANADVLGALNTQLQVRESYTAALSPFRMYLHTGPMELNKWNPVLLPLASAKVSRGRLDSLNMTAIGNDDYAQGHLQMYYQHLGVHIMNSNDPTEQSFKNKVISWLANALLLHKYNDGKNAPVFFERLKNKSPINFLIKTTLSGIKSGVGVPGVKKKQRNYFKKYQIKNKK
ncbi:MAG: hypothetical protein J7539_05045 [Niabella sp.]|nr:hypothetical protein [Niabella sp.]